ncbi:MAG: hypothetical protein HC875_14935 [Anaerolineales bacterium]|nr:hypothetical protein [Anaerolineales bacterium]
MDEDYIWENIRTLLNKGFTEEELRRFCHDQITFRPVFDRLAQHIGKAEIIDRIIEHAERHLLVEVLLDWAKRHNSARYKKHQPYNHNSEEDLIQIPLWGPIAAGEPNMLFKDPYDTEIEYTEVLRSRLPTKGEFFALIVRGRSMIDALINDGDTVIIDRSKGFINGDIVVAWLTKQREFTLKCFYNEGTRIRLQPRNEAMKPIYVHPDEVEIYGRVVAIIPSDQSRRSIYIR